MTIGINEFFSKVQNNIQRKQELYDGANKISSQTLDKSLRFCVEELGEISAAITRQRIDAAKAECLDLANSLYILYNKLNEQIV